MITGKYIQTGDIWGFMLMSRIELGRKRLATWHNKTPSRRDWARSKTDALGYDARWNSGKTPKLLSQLRAICHSSCPDGALRLRWRRAILLNVKKCVIQLRIDHNTNTLTSLHPGVGGNRKWVITFFPSEKYRILCWIYEHTSLPLFIAKFVTFSPCNSLRLSIRPYYICLVTLFHSFAWQLVWLITTFHCNFLVATWRTKTFPAEKKRLLGGSKGFLGARARAIYTRHN